MASTPRLNLNLTPMRMTKASDSHVATSARTSVEKSPSLPKLFDYKQYSTKRDLYNKTHYKLSNEKLNAWYKKKFPDKPEDSGDEIVSRPSSKQSSKPNTPAPQVKAIKNFYERYHTFRKSGSPFRLEKKPNAMQRYIQGLEETGQIPHPMGIVKWSTAPKELNLESYKMGNSYAAALSKGLEYMNPEEVNISDNRLSKNGTQLIIKELSRNVKVLNASLNSFDKKAANTLGEFVQYKAKELQILNMQNTNLGAAGTIELCSQTSGHLRLSEVNLSNNKITDQACDSIASMIAESKGLQFLSLHWNMISGEGGAKIMAACIKNPGFKVLDLSWNALGSGKAKMFAARFAEFLSYNHGLVHLDLSNNNIKQPECNVISLGLNSNHTLWGLHFSGNKARIDAKGFFQTERIQSDNHIESRHLSPRIHGVQMVLTGKNEEIKKLRKSDNCWICEGWKETLFEYHTPNSTKEPVYLHLECDEYQQDLMCPTSDGTKTHLYRMCPPGKQKFFFVFEGKPFLSPEYPVISYPLKITVNLPDKVFPKVEVNLTEVNCFDITANPSVINQYYEITVEKCMPRPIPGLFTREIPKRTRKPWSIPISVFRNYIPDTVEVFYRCFDEDWKHINKPKMKEENLEQCRLLFRKHYRIIKEAYKYYSGIGHTDSLFAINRITLTDFIAHKIMLYDGDKLKDMDLAVMAIKGKKPISKFQSKLALCRFEFLELLFRLALRKYLDCIFINLLFFQRR